MASLLYQQIEMLSREKHIEPEVVISAIEDAMVVAARKFYKTDEDLRGKFNADSGQVDVYSVLTVVEEKGSGRGARFGDSNGQAYGCAGTHRGTNRETGDPAEGARGGTRHDLQ